MKRDDGGRLRTRTDYEPEIPIRRAQLASMAAGCPAGSIKPVIPPIDLAGVPTISAELHRALQRTDGKPPTRKQQDYGRKMILRACAEIRRRRDMASLAALERYERTLEATREAVRRKSRKPLYD